MQRVSEYMYIIHTAVLNEFGTYLPFNRNFKEQMKFSFYDENMPLEQRKKLALLASQRVRDRLDLPEGVYLKECTIEREN